MRADRIASIVFILAGLLFWSQTGDLQYNGMIFPRLLIVFLVILSAVMFVQTWIVPAGKRARISAADLKYIVTTVVAVFLWVYLLDILGFMVSSVLVLTILTILLDLERPRPARILFTIGVYAVMVFAFWLVFHRFLLVPLPEGYLI